MYCKECGTENNDDSLRCNKCNTYLKSTNSPLTGGDRTKIIAFFAFLILPFGWFGGSVVIILIVIFGLYIMKKDRSFIPILKARKYIQVYLILLGLIITIIVSINSYNHFGGYNISNKEQIIAGLKAFIIGIILTPILVDFFIFIFDTTL